MEDEHQVYKPKRSGSPILRILKNPHRNLANTSLANTSTIFRVLLLTVAETKRVILVWNLYLAGNAIQTAWIIQILAAVGVNLIGRTRCTAGKASYPASAKRSAATKRQIMIVLWNASLTSLPV